MTNHLHMVPRLRVSGAIYPLPHTPSFLAIENFIFIRVLQLQTPVGKYCNRIQAPCEEEGRTLCLVYTTAPPPPLVFYDLNAGPYLGGRRFIGSGTLSDL